MHTDGRENQRVLNVTVTYEKLYALQQSIGLGAEDFRLLESHRDFLSSRKDEFAEYFFWQSHGIGETGIIMEHLAEPGLLKSVWSGWSLPFERTMETCLFTG